MLVFIATELHKPFATSLRAMRRKWRPAVRLAQQHEGLA
jgi:hypothetical protein